MKYYVTSETLVIVAHMYLSGSQPFGSCSLQPHRILIDLLR